MSEARPLTAADQEEKSWTEVGSGLADRVYLGAITGSALAVPLILGLVFVAIGIAAWPALRTFGVSFVTSGAWDGQRVLDPRGRRTRGIQRAAQIVARQGWTHV